MRRKWKIRQVIAGVMVMVAGMSAAQGNITVAWYRVRPNSAATTGVNTLVANGWVGYLLVATADTSSGTVRGWDLSTLNSTPGLVTSNRTGRDWGIFAGTGALAQRWARDPDTGVLIPTNYGTTPTLSGTPFNGFLGTLASSPDSFFFGGATFSQAVTPSEDNNLANGSNPPYSRNPVPDDTGGMFDAGVGTFMKAAGTVRDTAQAQTQVIAQVWLPAGSQYPVGAYGIVADPKGGAYTFTAFFAIEGVLPYPPDAPEPGTAGMLGVGVVMLMRRRRRGGFVGRNKGGL